MSDPLEMELVHRERVCRILFETGVSPGAATQTQFMLAYQSVLMKDTLFFLSELLEHERQKINR